MVVFLEGDHFALRVSPSVATWRHLEPTGHKRPPEETMLDTDFILRLINDVKNSAGRSSALKAPKRLGPDPLELAFVALQNLAVA